MKKILVFLFILTLVSVFAAEVSISDLSPLVPEYKAVQFLVESRIMELDENGNFKPSLLITKLDVARYLYTIIQNFNLLAIKNIEKRIASIDDDINLNKSLISGVDERLSRVEQQQKNMLNDLLRVEKFMSSASDVVLKVNQIESMLTAILEKNSYIESQIKNQNIVELSKKVGFIENELKSKYVTLDDLNSISLELTRLSEAYSAQFRSLDERLKKVEDLGDLSKRISILEKETNELKTNFLEEQAKNMSYISDINKKIENLPAEVSTLNERIAEVSTRLALVEKLYTSLKNIKPSQLSYVSKIPDLESKVDELETMLSNLQAISGDLDILRKKLEGIDVLTVRNVVNKFAIIENRYDQIESRTQFLEKKIYDIDAIKNQINELNARLSTFESSGIGVEKLSTLVDDVEQLKSFDKKVENTFDVVTEKMTNLSDDIKTLWTLTIISGIAAISAIILVWVKQ
ncbi:S-layer homology domain-containing protein [Thermosipho ferrireducens]|uniref:S-layer homology domain-containing protein n=1 Tax=Thermosipho ferrireducens TaxID=2571116 RepID=A0ABX7S5J2_9BACT|nr:S-layer homology domain-containing protein [Thermosipho ferrireducens]QTA37813.1 S-layer homology domain-containing protein [Thermosipho ferrireducens]